MNDTNTDREIKVCCTAFYQSDAVRMLLGDVLHPGGLALTQHLGEAMGLGPKDRVLDVACGRGMSGIHLAHCFGCHVTGLDFGAANIAAAEPGSSGNLPSGAIDSVEGRVGFLVSVTNPQTTRGGISEQSPSVRTSDRRSLRNELRTELLETAWSELEGELDTGQALVEDSLAVIDTLREDYDQEIGQPAVTLGLFMELEVQAYAYRLSDAEFVASHRLANDLPDDHVAIPGTIRLASLTEQDPSDQSTPPTIAFRAQQHVAQAIDFTAIRRHARGLSHDRAVDRLADRFSLSNPPKIALHPSWFPWIPWLPMRIDVLWAWEVT